MFVHPAAEEATGHTWDHILGPFSAGQLKLTLIDLFDWSVLQWRDFRHYRVKIHAFDGKPELVGGEGLVDVLDAEVLWNAGDV